MWRNVVLTKFDARARPVAHAGDWRPFNRYRAYSFHSLPHPSPDFTPANQREKWRVSAHGTKTFAEVFSTSWLPTVSTNYNGFWIRMKEFVKLALLVAENVLLTQSQISDTGRCRKVTRCLLLRTLKTISIRCRTISFLIIYHDILRRFSLYITGTEWCAILFSSGVHNIMVSVMLC